jgi:hypothetical protein
LVKTQDDSVAPAPGPRQRGDRPVRSSDRVNLVIPIEAFVTDVSGRVVTATGSTLVVSRSGATIVLNQALTADQELTIRCLPSKREVAARVLGPIAGRDLEFVYGIDFLNAAAAPWGIEFPLLNGAEDTLARAVLQCGSCPIQEIVHFDESDFRVFEANHSVPRFCRNCSATTSWKQADFPASTEGRQQPDSSGSETRKEKTKRKYERVKTKVSACIRRSGFPDEIVPCEDYSRGGFCFASPKPFRERSRIEVALPYAKTGNGNIFVHARIVHVQKAAGKFKVGCSYLNSDD